MMVNFFEKIGVSWKTITRSRKIMFLAAFLFVGLAIFTPTHFAHAGLADWATENILQLFSWLELNLTQMVLKLLLFVLTFVIEIAGYNGYLGSTAVSVGWVMVRDLTNMIFVVALLLIAFGTILGVEHYEWKHMLFKLVSAAIIVNFSRTICGLIIDVAQVVMITFVNGIAATVGGNFIRAFSLERMNSLSAQAVTGGPGTGGATITAANVWLASTASLFISVTILVATGAFLAMLVARVVVLWILIVLSPVAFVFGVLHQTEHYAAEWWSAFGKNVITGPVLVFFLWLTLVTVGNGMVNNEIANGSNVSDDIKKMTTTQSPQTAGIGQVMQWDNLVNFVIAIGMLIAGLQITSHLGGIGAGWAEHAVDYGKKVAGYASGLYAARATAQKGQELAGQGIELAKQKMPLVGGEARERYKNAITGYATSKYARWMEKRIEKGQERMNAAWGVDEKTGKPLTENFGERWKARVGHFFWTPGKIKNKMAEDIKEAGEARMEVIDTHLMSTSKTAGGIDKSRARGRLRMREHTGPDFQGGRAAEEDERREKIYQQLKRMDELEKELGKAGGNAQKEAAIQKEMSAINANLAYLSPEELREHRSDMGRADKARDWRDREKTAEKMAHEPEHIREGEAFEKKMEPVMLGQEALKVTGDERSLEAVKARLERARVDEVITEEQEKKMFSQLEYQHRQAKVAELEKRAEVAHEIQHEEEQRQGAREEERLVKEDHGFHHRHEKAAKMGAEIKNIQDKLQAEKELTNLKAMRELLQDLVAQGRQTSAAKFKAEEEYGSRELSRNKELELARQKDKVLVDDGHKPRFYLQTIASHTKELEDQLSGLNFREITSRSGIVAKELEDLVSDTNAAPDEIRKKSAEMISVLAANSKQGSENFLAALENARAAIGYTDTVRADNPEDMQRLIVSIMRGKVVGQDRLGTEFSELQKIHSPEVFNTMMRNMDDALKKAGREFAPLSTGLFNDRKVDDNGVAQYTLETEPGNAKGNRDYWAGKVNATAVQTLKGMVTTEYDAERKTMVVTRSSAKDRLDQSSRDNFVNVFRRVSRGTHLNNELVKEWATMSEEVKAALLEELRAKAGEDRYDIVKERLEGKKPTEEERRGKPSGGEDDEEPEDTRTS